MNILELISTFFVENGFSSIDFGYNKWSSCIFKPDSTETEVVYIVIDMDGASESDLRVLQDNGCENIKISLRSLSCYESYFDKNASLIVCYSGPVAEDSAVIRQLEEDPYFFKKNVLKYSSDSVGNLVDYLGGDFSLLNMNKKIMNPEMFDRMKADAVSGGGYELLCNLFIKIPAIRFLRRSPATLHSLTAEIDSILSVQGMIPFRDEIMNLSIDDIDDFDKLNALIEIIERG